MKATKNEWNKEMVTWKINNINKLLAQLTKRNRRKSQTNEIKDVKILQYSPVESRGLGHIFKPFEVRNSQRNVWASLCIWQMKVKSRRDKTFKEINQY